MLVRSGSIVIKGGAYYRDKMFERDGKLYLKTDVKSPDTWVHLVLIILSFTAMVDIAWSTVNYVQLSGAIIILSFNWTVGANILMVLGDLGRQENKSIYFEDGKKGVRSFSTVSGFWINSTESYKSFTYSAIIPPLISLMMLAVLLFSATGIFLLLAALARWLFA
ncbi:hypothetical protein [uncultured Roseobacter sp.]|uniref:hypothetical protein n=1 Tax=uncultured Roseobacter sp. TaxID=114847 RepID=UPI00260CCD60|nr:hypothetical protein [uncultured Roseobacter sp.]